MYIVTCHVARALRGFRYSPFKGPCICYNRTPWVGFGSIALKAGWHLKVWGLGFGVWVLGLQATSLELQLLGHYGSSNCSSPCVWGGSTTGIPVSILQKVSKKTQKFLENEQACLF